MVIILIKIEQGQQEQDVQGIVIQLIINGRVPLLPRPLPLLVQNHGNITRLLQAGRFLTGNMRPVLRSRRVGVRYR